MITIKEFDSLYQTAVTDHILDIENNEFDMALSLADQPDLVDISNAYQKQNGNFWIALEQETIIGTTGIYSLPGNIGELRRMFVKPQYRGAAHGVGQGLLDISLSWSKANGYTRIFLETTDWLVAAGKFYTKNNFKAINKTRLPATLPVLRQSGKFMVLDLE